MLVVDFAAFILGCENIVHITKINKNSQVVSNKIKKTVKWKQV